MPLKFLEERDLAMVLNWRNSAEVRKYSFTQHKIAESEHHQWFERNRHNPAVRVFVFVEKQGNPSGVVCFTDYDEAKRTAYWGFYAAPDSVPGVGSRLALEAIDYAFETLRLQNLYGEVLLTNDASLRFHRKLGFREKGLFEKDHKDHDQPFRVVRFSLSDSEWRERRDYVRQRDMAFNGSGNDCATQKSPAELETKITR
jgi:UDP-4-amino-4,6-dideoxy-N-acetyl-beta-L-altrosamine N-acetyltransferase